MKLSCVVALFAALSGTAIAAQPMSRADHMKACAEKWKSSQGHGLKYQHFMGDCMKSIAAKTPVHA